MAKVEEPDDAEIKTDPMKIGLIVLGLGLTIAFIVRMALS